MKYGKAISFLGGVLMGTAGVAVLSSKDAKKVYTHAAAAVLRGKDGIMKTAAIVKENCGDIYADAKDINDRRYDEQEKADVEKARAIVEQYECKTEDDNNETTE